MLCASATAGLFEHLGPFEHLAESPAARSLGEEILFKVLDAEPVVQTLGLEQRILARPRGRPRQDSHTDHLLHALAKSWGPNMALLPFLQHGVPIGAVSALPPSLQWPAKKPDSALPPDLEICEGNWKMGI